MCGRGSQPLKSGKKEEVLPCKGLAFIVNHRGCPSYFKKRKKHNTMEPEISETLDNSFPCSDQIFAVFAFPKNLLIIYDSPD